MLTLDPGAVFGEDKMFFNCPNRFHAKVTSFRAHVIRMSLKVFHTTFKAVLPLLVNKLE